MYDWNRLNVLILDYFPLHVNTLDDSVDELSTTKNISAVLFILDKNVFDFYSPFLNET